MPRRPKAVQIPAETDNSAEAAALRMRYLLSADGMSGPVLLQEADIYRLSNRQRMRAPFPEDLIEAIADHGFLMWSAELRPAIEDGHKKNTEIEDIALRLAALHDNLEWPDKNNTRRPFQCTRQDIIDMGKEGRKRMDIRFETKLKLALSDLGFTLMTLYAGDLTNCHSEETEFVIASSRILRAQRKFTQEDMNILIPNQDFDPPMQDSENHYLVMKKETMDYIRILGSKQIVLYRNAEEALDMLRSQLPNI